MDKWSNSPNFAETVKSIFSYFYPMMQDKLSSNSKLVALLRLDISFQELPIEWILDLVYSI